MCVVWSMLLLFFFQAEDGIRDSSVTGVQTCALPISPADYLTKILTARVYDVAVESDLEPAKALSRRLHNKVLLKREDQQPVFSFKLRGAYNKMAHQIGRASCRERV